MLAYSAEIGEMNKGNRLNLSPLVYPERKVDGGVFWVNDRIVGCRLEREDTTLDEHRSTRHVSGFVGG